MRKALLIAATAAFALVTLAPTASAAPPKLIGCNDEDALINIHSPFPDCKPPTD